MHVEETLKVNITKDDKSLKKYNEIWEKVGNSIKKDSIVNLHTIKNI